MIKWTEKEPKSRRTIICYYQGSKMLYWINADGHLCDAHTGMLSFTKNACWKTSKIKQGHWEYANYG